MRRLARDMLWMAAATGASRLLGLFRDIAIAARFGMGASYDAFLIAFFVPHFLRQLLAEGALSMAFVPSYTGILANREDADRFASNVLSWLLVVFPVLVLLGVVFAPSFVPFLASGFDPQKLQLTIRLTRWVLPFIGVIGLAAVFMGILNAHLRFFAASFAPVWYNVGMLVGILVLARFTEPPILGVAFGVLLGGTAQLLSQLPSLRRMGFRFRPHLLPMHREVGHMLRLMAPALGTLAVTQVNLMVDNKLASHLGDGGVAALQYGMRLFQLPLGILAVSLATALLPRFSRAWSQGDARGFERYLEDGLLTSIMLLLPAMVGLLLLGTDVIRLLFEHGSFGPQETARTARVLSYYVIGLAPYGLIYVLSRAAYAQGRTMIPLIGSLLAVGVNVGLDLLLVRSMQESGLALATAIAGLANVVVLLCFALQGHRLSRDALPRLGWILLGSGLLAGVVAVTHWTVRSAALPIVVFAPTLVGIGLYAIYLRVTPLWKLLVDLRAQST